METIAISEPQSKKLSMGSKRGRPKLDCKVHQIRFTLSLREGEDDDLLFFFEDIPERRRAAALKPLCERVAFHSRPDPSQPWMILI